MLTPEQLQQIKEREKNASPGPWRHLDGSIWSCDCGFSPCNLCGNKKNPNFMLADIRGWGHLRSRRTEDAAIAKQDANAEFMAHSRVDIADLLAHVEQLGAESTDEYNCLTKALAVIEKHLPNNEDLYRELSAFQRSICK